MRHRTLIFAPVVPACVASQPYGAAHTENEECRVARSRRPAGMPHTDVQRIARASDSTRGTEPRIPAPLWGMIALQAAVFSLICIVKYRYYLYADSDLAIFAQAADGVLRGSFFSSIRGMNWLGDHVSLVIVLVSPLYAVLRHPLTLLLLQTATLALGALPVFTFARRELGEPRAALAFALLYLLYPPMGYANLYEFHPEVLATTTVLAMFSCMAADRFVATLIFAGLSLSCREDVAPLVAMAAAWSLLPGRPRRGRYAASLMMLAVGSLVLSFAVIRPAVGSAAAEYGMMYERWGKDLGEVVRTLVSRPWSVLVSFFSSPGEPYDSMLKRQYWILMLAPVAFLSLLSPLSLAVALPILAEHFMSSRPNQHRIVFHYSALITPIVMIAAVKGCSNLLRLVERVGARAAGAGRPGVVRGRVLAGVMIVALTASVTCNLVFGPLLRLDWIPIQDAPEARWPGPIDRALRSHRDRMVRRVPASGGVVASGEFLASFASRPDVHSLHHIIAGSYTYSSKPYPIPTGIVALIENLQNPIIVEYTGPHSPRQLRRLIDLNRLRPVAAAGDNVLFLREPADTLELFRVGAEPPSGGARVVYDDQLEYLGAALPEPVTVAGGILPVQTHWRRMADIDRHFLVELSVRSATGAGGFRLVRQLGYLLYPPVEWPRDLTVRETYRLVIPAGSAAGDYLLRMRVAGWRDRPRAATASRPDDSSLPGRGYWLDLGTFTVSSNAQR